MFIQFKDKNTEKQCTDFRVAKKQLNDKIAKKLFKAINIIENARTLEDIVNYGPFHFHPLKGKLKGKYAIDIDGRKSSYRLIIVPVDECRKEYKDIEWELLLSTNRIILIWEVSNHYE